MSATRSGPVDTGAIVVGTSALAVVVGAFLGWFTVPIGSGLGSIEGIDLVQVGSPVFNGLVTVTVASVVTVVALFASNNRWANVVTATGGLAIELVAVAFVVAPDLALGPTIDAGAEVTLASVGVGIMLTLLGGVGVLLGGALSYRE